MRMSWGTVPICDSCWEKEHGSRTPIRLRQPESETCFNCGHTTESGIYVRAKLPPISAEDAAQSEGDFQ